MKFSINQFNLRVLFVFTAILLNSCSKDSDDPTPQETTITVSTADFAKTMDENPTSGQVIGTVLGSTSEGSVTFSIIEQTPSGAFSIDAASGELKVADETLFDFETNPTITGTVKVANGSIFKNALVTINLDDVNEENIFTGSVRLFTQTEVETFGSNNYTAITGTLLIGSLDNLNSQITDLSSLNTLKSIGGQLNIIQNERLAVLTGLQNIHTVTNDVNIAYNRGIHNLESLNGLTTLHRQLTITENLLLENFNGLQNLIEIDKDLRIWDNPALKNIDALTNLISVGDKIAISGNDLLQNINGLQGLTSIEGDLEITSNNAMLNIEGLQNIETINGISVKISGNDALVNLNGLNNISTLFSLTIDDNSSLENVDGLSNLHNLKGLSITNNPLITNIEAVSNITSFESGVSISHNESLPNINGLRNVLSVGGTRLEISYNNSLENLDGLQSLQNVGGTLYIIKNPLLSNMDSLENLQTVGYKLYIWSNDALTNLCGLRPLLLNNGLGDEYQVFANAFNPTKQDIIDGNCSL
ncbi:cadherin repeat domain-containing protein [Aequorivita antarctica]|uniref:Cadherin repeat domain-containing protein n=1 Tax=Aequorivita antarctica TaxID=153266 RepID=A0A5C6YV85_9FLAO|nr:cadherin repeat domain-containing protein [Aequorivita antarctica]TXD71513.1 cadherin repeat domain-containing protein [Aequorivita antarctica]SRX76068.1 hypothetical protein AEQU3_03066 [Aequorivita antarctica]